MTSTNLFDTKRSRPLAAPTDDTVLIYDGDCPFYARYVALIRLREAVGPVMLENARNGGAHTKWAQHVGLDLDEGMVLIYRGQAFHGADVVHRLALLSSSSSLFNRINAYVFRAPRVARLLYPILRAGRNAVLRLLGRNQIDQP